MVKNFGETFILFTALICITSLLPSCRVAKHLPEGQSLLVKNKIKIKIKAKAAEKEKLNLDLYAIAAQKPNKRVFNFAPVRLWFYYSAAHSKKLTKFKQWIMDKVGEAPVVYDSTMVKQSRDYMREYLFNYGYFHASVTDTVITKNKKTTIVFNVEPKELWTIKEVELPKGHTSCDSIVRANYKASFLKKGDRIDVTNLKKERDRIETICRNSGYFLFNREYVTFDYDSFTEDKNVTIRIILNHPNDAAEHVQFYLNNIYIISDYSVELGDTLHRDTVKLGDYTFIAHEHKFKNKILAEAIFFKKNELYSKDAEVQTINHLSQLGIFKFISVDYSKPKDREGNYLDCTLQLTPAKKEETRETGEFYVSSEGLLGASGTISYKNKNLTKRADQLLLDVTAGIQIRFPTREDKKVQIMSVTAAVGLTYYMNKFLVPFRAKIFSARANPKTRFSVNYNFDNQFDFDATGKNVVFLYQLHNFNASFGYEWNKGREQHHLLNPIAIDFFLLPKVGVDFTTRLNSNPPLKSSFQEQVIIGPNYTFSYNNSKSNSDRKYMKLRIGLETAGNVIDGIFKAATNNTEHDSVYLIANKPFAQYFRMEVDWSNFIKMTNHSQFCIRTYAGVGVPYGNSFTLPFIKQFFVGGPNSLRGFQIREIGPGSYVPDTLVFNPETGKKTNVGFFNQTGDIKLETNAEIRFDIYKWLKGCVFADAGNVWTLKKDAVPNGDFNISRFWSEFAVDAGAGLRLDFSYFVIRFDYGFPLRDPRRVVGERWQFQNAVAFKNGAFQLAIGYPF